MIVNGEHAHLIFELVKATNVMDSSLFIESADGFSSNNLTSTGMN
jgi:hypothetical protein